LERPASADVRLRVALVAYGQVASTCGTLRRESHVATGTDRACGHRSSAVTLLPMPARTSLFGTATGAAVIVFVALAAVLVSPQIAGSDANPGTPAAAASGASGSPTDVPGVRVTSRQSVTVDGRFTSLREVIEQLCAKSGVVLRSYTAPDRAVEAHYDDVSLREALERLLAQESFAFGIRKKAETAHPKLTWLRVFGGNQRGRYAAQDGRRTVELPRAAFSSPNASSRQRAIESFARRLGTDADLRRSFLRTPDGALVDQLRGHRYASAFLGGLAARVGPGNVRSKVMRLRSHLTAAH